ncbi:WD40 repeat domain-containing protein [Hahella sp. KA22]|uniref:WD40 repeat domain-containing protein n=1 Tax=Hahella sp. KA22 TaxID=1628392 RepID=UPI000FDF1AF9|nr:WD40 repeat domain-containing protein [Hahella sp. KA22]AZZ93843.1 WD40 repeat domain-containing protein [Hahella sp. KA22]QAY57216.1 WD40 repeat domain-containing protein [Hahella sp. KA22]
MSKRNSALLLLSFIFPLVGGCLTSQEIVPAGDWEIKYSHSLSKFPIKRIEFSPDSELLFVGALYDNAKVLATDSGAVDGSLTFQGKLINASFISDSSNVALAYSDGRVQLMDSRLDSRHAEYLFPVEAKKADFSKEGRYVAYGNYLYDFEGKELNHFAVKYDFQTGLSFSNNDILVASGFRDRAVYVVDPARDRKVTWKASGDVLASAISSDGSRAFIALDGGVIQVWDVGDAPSLENELDLGESAELISLSEDGKILSVVGKDDISIVSAEALKVLSRKKNEETNVVRIQDNGLVLVGAYSGAVDFWNEGLKAFHRLKIADESVTALDYSTQKKLIAIGTANGQVYLVRWPL